jgi:hypothetical protein
MKACVLRANGAKIKAHFTCVESGKISRKIDFCRRVDIENFWRTIFPSPKFLAKSAAERALVRSDGEKFSSASQSAIVGDSD